VGLESIRDVPRDLRESNKLAFGIANSVDYNERPKAAPVIAHAPAFRMETAGLFRDLQSMRRYSGSPIFGCVELAECCPTIASAEYCLSRSAPAFQLTTWPLTSSMKMA
jgi:hypothetical protein